MNTWPKGKIIKHVDNEVAFYVQDVEECANGELNLFGSWLRCTQNNQYMRIENDQFYVDRNYLLEKYETLPEPKLAGSKVKFLVNTRVNGRVEEQSKSGMLKINVSSVEDSCEVHWIDVIQEDVNV
jgi:hypothetical protein